MKNLEVFIKAEEYILNLEQQKAIKGGDVVVNDDISEEDEK